MGTINTADVKWAGDLAFEGTSGSGHTVTMDGERQRGASPMEHMLFALGGCSGVDVVLILKRMREDVTDVRCHLEAERGDEEPKPYTRIHAHYTVTGKNLQEAKVARAIELSVEKYCPVIAMLGKTAAITHDFEIVEA